MSAPLSDAEVLERLRSVTDPCSVAAGRPTDIVAFGLVREATGGERPRVRLRLTEPTCLYRVWFMRAVRDAVGPDTTIEFAPADDLWGPED
ncbi:MAG: hypothetical protein ACRD0O_12230 [Acidimicrobiia bacterium]